MAAGCHRGVAVPARLARSGRLPGEPVRYLTRAEPAAFKHGERLEVEVSRNSSERAGLALPLQPLSRPRHSHCHLWGCGTPKTRDLAEVLPTVR